MPAKLVQVKGLNGTDLRPYMVGMHPDDKGAHGKAAEFALEDISPEHFNKGDGPDYIGFGQYGLEVKTKTRFALDKSYTSFCTMGDHYTGATFDDLPELTKNKILSDWLLIQIGDLVIDSHEFIYYDEERRKTLKEKFNACSKKLSMNNKNSATVDGFLLERKPGKGGCLEFRVLNKRMYKFHQSLKNSQCFNELFERT